jgi:hypothetical protein
MKKIYNIDMNHNTLGLHFIKHFKSMRSAKENMLVAKKNYDSGKSLRWEVYVKAYNWDTKEQLDERD